MRKQTKFVAVLSAAALLAIGASMTSFAAWTEENGTWVFYNRSGERVTEDWQKSGDNWFWLNEDGEMAMDTLVEDDGNYYYVNSAGAMVQNRWISIENEDYDGEGDDEPANYWYYFGSNGKAYKSTTNSNNASFKTINGKKYIFDDEGKMLYGWINLSGERETGDEAWQNGTYYCGDENDGAQKAGQWAYLDIIDNTYDSVEPGTSSPNTFDDEEQTRWFYFKTNGRKMTSEKGKTIDGQKYSFDQYGRMNAEWVYYANTGAIATPVEATQDSAGNAAQGNSNYTTGFRYYGSPESGARKTKGWFQVVPDSYLSIGDYDDDEDNWYYSDKDGKLVASELKTISGKKYAFNSYGVMQSGLKAVKLGSDNKTILDVKGADNATLIANNMNFDTEDAFKENISRLYGAGYTLYYFGSGSDGALKTGKQTVSIDGTNYTFLFNKSGTFKGQGKFGIDDHKYYAGGMLMAADRTDRYAVVKVVQDAAGNYEEIELMTTDDFLSAVRDGSADAVTATSGVPSTLNADKYDEYYTITVDETVDATSGLKTSYKLVNTAGTVQKSKSKAKDGDGRCFDVSGEKIQAVYVES